MRLLSVLTASVAAMCLATVTPPPKPIFIDVPNEIGAAVIDGNALYALTSKNELLRVDLQGRRATTIVVFPAETKAETLTVADGLACIQARDDKSATTFYVVDVAAEKMTHTIKTHLVGPARPGFLRGGRLYMVYGLDLQIYTVSTGQLESKIKVGGGIVADSHRVGDRLYLAREYAGGLGVIDMKEGKLLDLIDTKDWFCQVRVGKDKAFVWGEFNGVGAIDLKTREYAALEQPEAGVSHSALTIQSGPDDDLLVYSTHSTEVYQYNSAGKIVGHTPVGKSAGTFFGAWNASAVFTSGKGVALFPLAKPPKEMD